MKIVADENIPFVYEFFSHIGDITIYSGRKLSSEQVKDADILLVRSVTRVDKHLLEGSKVKFVGTCTIGTDHIDQAFLTDQGIAFASAPGCNANAVVDYVLSALSSLALSNGFSIYDKCVGIVGQGNVGSRLKKRLEGMGIATICTDPPMQRQGVEGLFSLEEVINQADIISLHTPLTKSGADATYHLLDKHRIQQMKEGAILINTSRGPVINNSDLLACLNSGTNLAVVLDVWENEPLINLELMDKVDLATQHIAGYSIEGKTIGTAMIYRAVCKFLGEQVKIDVGSVLPPREVLPGSVDVERDMEAQCYHAVLRCYDIQQDDEVFRSTLKAASSEEQRSDDFDKLRKNYPQRRELAMVYPKVEPHNAEWIKKLNAIGMGTGKLTF